MSRTEKWCSCLSRIPPCTPRTPWPASRWPRLYWHWRAAGQCTGPPRPWPPAPWPLPSSCRAGACQAQLTWVVTLPLPLYVTNAQPVRILTSQAQVQSPSQALNLNPQVHILIFYLPNFCKSKTERANLSERPTQSLGMDSDFNCKNNSTSASSTTNSRVYSSLAYTLQAHF